ncbi:unnamed protein product [Protopolystoma xenopodis]|uniref:CUB domain-containing protein n=1 Tax=Protopolystoma xenopodis TaxID=117903 RepID=A0A3S5CHK5_9PLAT|nr:unnamed protein product [Protopolystoma xenopodis]
MGEPNTYKLRVRHITTCRYCGLTPPPPLISTSSRLWIEYRRSEGNPSTGFIAEYEALCGGTLEQEQGTITSPSNPEFYGPNRECIWKIIVPEGFSVALTFHSFQVSQNQMGLDPVSKALHLHSRLHRPLEIAHELAWTICQLHESSKGGG